MSKKTLPQCKSGRDFCKHAEKHPNLRSARHTRGSHRIYRTDKGSCVVPYHNKDMGNGLRAKIIKIFALIGLGVVVCAYFGVI